jgi:hypothetical protein
MKHLNLILLTSAFVLGSATLLWALRVGNDPSGEFADTKQLPGRAVSAPTSSSRRSSAASGQDVACQALKLKLTRITVSTMLRCHSRAAGQGVAVDSNCISSAEDRLPALFAAAEVNNVCSTIGDATASIALADSFVAEIAHTLRPTLTPSHCAATKLKVTRKTASTTLAAFASHKKSSDNARLASGIAKAQQQLSRDFAKADGRSDCQTFDDASIIQSDIDAFVDELTRLLYPWPRATIGTVTALYPPDLLPQPSVDPGFLTWLTAPTPDGTTLEGQGSVSIEELDNPGQLGIPEFYQARPAGVNWFLRANGPVSGVTTPSGNTFTVFPDVGEFEQFDVYAMSCGDRIIEAIDTAISAHSFGLMLDSIVCN